MPSSPSTLRARLAPHAAWLVGMGVPLLIVFIASWQWSRAWEWNRPGEVVRYLGVRGGPSRIDEWLIQIAPASLLLGLLALALFAWAVVTLRRASARAMLSRDALLEAFEGASRWLPMFLVVQTSLVFLGLAGVITFEVLHLLDGSNPSRGTAKLIFFGMALAAWLLWTVGRVVYDMIRFALRKPALEPIMIMGQQLSATQAPQLWRYVQEVAEVTGGTMPDAVVVGLNEGFFVTEHPVALLNGQAVAPGRTLYLPLPYMAFLDRDQVAAVIAHELGHFTGEDTVYSLRFTPIYQAMVGSILAIANGQGEGEDELREMLTRPATLFGKWFLQNFDEAVQHWSRQRELAADAFGATFAGTQPAALALLRISALQEVVEHALQRNRESATHQREGVLSMVRRLVAEQGLSDPSAHLEERQSHPLDTHPTLKQRLEALNVALTPELAAQAQDRAESGLLSELGLEAGTASSRAEGASA